MKTITNKRLKIVVLSILLISILPVIYYFVMGDLGVMESVIIGITTASSSYLIGQSASDTMTNYKNRD